MELYELMTLKPNTLVLELRHLIDKDPPTRFSDWLEYMRSTLLCSEQHRCSVQSI